MPPVPPVTTRSCPPSMQCRGPWCHPREPENAGDRRHHADAARLVTSLDASRGMPFAYRVTCSGRRVRAASCPPTRAGPSGRSTRGATPTRGSRVACALTRRGRLTDRAVSPIARWASIHPRPESQKYGLRPTPCRLANRSHASHQRSRRLGRSPDLESCSGSRRHGPLPSSPPSAGSSVLAPAISAWGRPNEAERTGQGVRSGAAMHP